MALIRVCPTDHARAIAARVSPSHVVAISSPGDQGLDGSDAELLRLVFHDVTAPSPGVVPPDASAIAYLLRFAAYWDGARPFLVHCQMGISRSPATAFIIACARDPGHPEDEIAAILRERAPCCTPNRLMVALADDLLGRSGRMIAAIDRIGRGIDYVPQAGFELPCG